MVRLASLKLDVTFSFWMMVWSRVIARLATAGSMKLAYVYGKIGRGARAFTVIAASILLMLTVQAELAPHVVWANRAGGPLPDSAMAIAADAAGNLYVAGTFAGTASFGATTLTAPVGADLFLAKLSTSGTWLWAKDIEALVPGIYPCYLQLDTGGNPVLVTSIPGDVVGDGLNQLLAAKYSSAGTAIWTRKFKPGSLSSVIGGGLAIDNANNLYITGAFGNRVDFGGVTLTDSGNGDIFIVKLASSGSLLAVRQFGQPGVVPDQGKALALDSLGNVYCAASFGGKVSFGNTTLTSAGSSDVALVKLDANLNPLWARRVGNVGDDDAFQLTRDAANNFTLLAAFSEDTTFGTNRITAATAGLLFATRFNMAGDFSWGTSLGVNTVALSDSRGLATDAAGNLLIAGGRLLAKLDLAGRLVWAKGAGLNFGISYLTGVAVLNATNVFVSGSIPAGTAQFDSIALTSAGSDDAVFARLLIDLTPPPIITAQPNSQTVLNGDNASFSVTANGAGPLAYQWFFGNRLITGATNSSLLLTNVSFAAAGVYYAVVSNSGGSVTSPVAQLTVNVRPPTITQQPISQTVDVGADAQFTVAATGLTPLFYQWRFHGTNLSGQSTSLLALRGVRAIDGGPYSVVVGNSGGYTTSLVATLTVRTTPPVVTAAPRDVVTTEGAQVTFSVSVSGTAPFTYRWLHNGAAVLNGTSSTLTLNNVQDADAGAYSVTISNAAGSTSATASLSLLHPTLNGEPFTWNFLMPNFCGSTVTALATDAAGNIYLTANQANMPIPGLVNDNACGSGFSVAKIDSGGRGLWRSAGWGTSTLQVSVANLQPDVDGNILVAGSFSGTITFGPLNAAGVPLTSTGGKNLFLAKFGGSNGTLLWVKRVTAAFPSDLVVDEAGNCFLTGTLLPSSTASFGSINIVTANTRPFVARADRDGNFIWVRTAGAKTTGAIGSSLSLDTSGDLWVAGTFNGTLEYGTNLFTSVYPPPNNFGQRASAFVARMSQADGSVRWSRSFQARDQVPAVYRIAAHPTGGAFLVIANYGALNYPPVAVPEQFGSVALRLDENGNPQAAFVIPVPLKDAVANRSGNLLLAADLPGYDFGGFTLPRPNGQNIAGLLQLNPDLTPQLARSVSGLKGTESASSVRLALSRHGDALLAGNFAGTNVVFGPLVSHASFSSGAFLAKLGPAALPALTAHLTSSKVSLTWSAQDSFVLERVDVLGESFVPFAYSPRTNLVDGTLTVDIPTSEIAAFFRLRK